ncbi:MAG: sigma-70 family RNA polymerase sigma factor [Bacteroidetes bacterium]|nr:sigma-70 family RNA polymerase sigma factor [Bacteroidota bacterium]
MQDKKSELSFKQEEKDAFELIFYKHHDELYRYGLKLCKNEELVKDSIQDLFLRLWKVRDNLNKIEILRPYLFRSFRNQILDNIKIQTKNLTINEELADIIDLKYSEVDFLKNEKITDEDKARVISALNQLKPKQKEIVYLRYFEELSFESIAIIMEMNVQSVRNTMHKAIQSLRELMLFIQFLILVPKCI